jgi:astacin (peptidase family M12A)
LRKHAFHSFSPDSKLVKRIPVSLLLCLLGNVVIAGPAAKNVDNRADIAVIDRALATEKRGDQWIRFGDVGLTRQQLQIFRDRLVAEQKGEASAAPQPEVVTPPTTFKWPSGNVYYRFDPTQVSNSTITAAKMQAFRDGVAEWAAFANLTFIEFTTPLPTNYITVSQQSSGEGGFSNSVGMKQTPGEQLIQIGPNSWNRGTICHEMGHALGLFHEQQRDDRDPYVVINLNNIDSGNQGNFTKLPGGTTAIGAYDFYSVMHYSRAALTNKPGTPNPNAPDPAIDTVDPVTPTYLAFLNIMGNVYDRTLSKLDRAGMVSIYGNPAVLPSAIVTNTKDSGSGSLRAAIYFAYDKSTDAPPVPTTVTFHIPTSDPNYNAGTGVFTIRPTFLMVAPGAGTTIDGSTQTAFTGDTNTSGPEIVIDGSTLASSGLGLFASGFLLHDMNCTIKNLVINGFNQQGIAIDGTRAALFSTSASGNVISGCYIGTDRTGGVAVPNTFPGIEMFGGASNNTVGGTTAAARNVISGNAHYGISINGTGCSNNLIQGNYIGLDQGGTNALPNTAAGIGLFGGAHNNTIGGTSTSARNVISGNKDQGVQILNSGTNGNVVIGNYIGLNAAGNAAVANGFDNPATHFFVAGIDIFGGAQNNIIGGTTAGSGNVISGNAASGVAISQSGTNGNLVQGNFIGTNPSGSVAIGNGFADPPNFYRYSGVAIFGGAQSNIVGGTTAGASNLVSGNAAYGVAISDVGTSTNLVQGNFIGTNTGGTGAIANAFAGVGIRNGATSNTIGGTSTSARNVISGNANQGVVLGDAGTSNNLVQGNFIGVNAAGTGALPNVNPGVSLFLGAQSNTIGGTAPGARNIISGNSQQAITIGDSGTNSNLIQGNYIGLDVTGIVKVANTSTGIDIFGGAQSNVIGGTAAGARNFICGGTYYGVALSGINTNSNLVQGNTIGLNVAGTVVANGFQGVALFQAQQSDPSGPQLNFIGGTAVGASNIIAGNTNEGVALFNAGTIKNTISENSIFSNGGGITLNTGSNNSQAAPTVNSATLSTLSNPNGTDVSVSMTGSGSTTFRIEFFATPSGGSQGKFLVGSANLNGGTTNLVVPLTSVVPAGYGLTATATAPNGDTSAFSNTQICTTTDSEGDGLPDNWENAHTLTDPNGDADGDGFTNLQEFLAGTDPRNPNSRLMISSIDRSAGNPRINFTGLTGKTYRLEYRDDLIAGSWLTLVDQILSTGATIQIVDPSASGVTRRFYRLRVLP